MSRIPIRMANDRIALGVQPLCAESSEAGIRMIEKVVAHLTKRAKVKAA